MHITPLAILLCSVAASTHAFVNTVPFVAWSSHESSTSRRISACHAGQLNSSAPLREVLKGDDVCDYDAVALMEYPGLHASDLRFLSSSSMLKHSVDQATYSAQLPYSPANSGDVLEILESLSTACGARLVQTGSESHLPALEDSKQVIHIRLPAATGEGTWRRDIISEHESIIARHISTVEAFTPKALFVLMGSLSQGYSKRQFDGTMENEAAFLPGNSSATGGILAHYQLLTPALILSLLVVFFVLVPIVIASINVLTSIQSSLRLDGPKAVGQDKKNQ